MKDESGISFIKGVRLNVEYWWQTPKVCRRCWRRMKIKRMSMCDYKCPRCGVVRRHSGYGTYVIKVGENG